MEVPSCWGEFGGIVPMLIAMLAETVFGLFWVWQSTQP